MLYHITQQERSAGGHPSTVFTLTSPERGSHAEVWVGNGFNCLTWVNRGEHLLHRAAEWEENPVPTRSGHPILFPFPNRIAQGRTQWAGKSIELPKNDSTKQNAIHGSAPRVAWDTTEFQAEAEFSSVKGTFRLQQHAPDLAVKWPGDGELQLEYILQPDCLQVNATVANRSTEEEFPFGLGYHPYFRLPHGTADDWQLQMRASSYWPLVDSIPTGEVLPCPSELDFSNVRPLKDLQLDHVLTGIQPLAKDEEFSLIAVLQSQEQAGKLEIWVTSHFRELVLFIPPHRQAVCIEPYTCTTNAINLHARGIDAGWQSLPPGGQVEMKVRYRWVN
ncbi:MAG: aldose 1-epimerase [Zavarzinella sp.]